MQTSLLKQLYREPDRDCLHLESYQILIRSTQAVVCGPCFFRDGYQTEVPTRINRRVPTRSGAEHDPIFIEHLTVSVGLVPPAPGQALSEYRAQRSIRSQPSPKQHPVTTALWELMGKQPKMASVLVEFCEGKPEVLIAENRNRSLFDVVDTLRKSVHTGQKFLRV